MDITRKRKKNSSIVQRVKKKFQKNFARTSGTRLDSDIYEYFLRVFQQSKQEFTDFENRQIFIDNVFSETEGHEIEYSCNQLVSRILEGFLPECSETVLERYLTVFGEDLRPLCCNQFASHVLETLMRISSKKVLEYHIHDEMDLKKHDDREVYLNFMLKVSKFLLNNIDEFILNTYANRVTRCAISCLSGDTINSKIDVKTLSKHTQQINVSADQLLVKKIRPREFKMLLKQFANWTLCSHMFTEYAKNILLSGLVQSVLLSLHSVGNKKYLKSLSLKLIDELYCSGVKRVDILQVLEYQQAVHLLNTIIITSSDKVYEEIRCKCFTGQLKDMALSKTANYCVQKFIERSPTIETFDSVYEELSCSFGKIIECLHTGVILSVSKICHKLQRKEKSFIKDLRSSLSCEETQVDGKGTNNFVLRLLFLDQSLQAYCNIGLNNVPINLHGCLILQEILKFSKPDKIVKSLLDIESSLFIKILCDQKGSHIANAFFGSERITDKCRNKFIDKIKGSYAQLATNKYGSFVFDALWKVADIKDKLSIVEELSNKESSLLISPSGKYIAKTVGLETYRHQPKEWENVQRKINDSRQLFSDIIK